jgi:Transposase
MKKPSQHLIAKVPLRPARVEMTIGIDLGDVWSHYCTLNEEGEAVDRGRFRTGPKGVEKWFTDLPPARIAMEAGTHSIWISEQLQELGHEVIVANVRELRAISHSDRKSDQVDAEKLARFARLDPKILRPIGHRTVRQQEALTLIRARPHRPATYSGGERRARADEVLWPSDASFFDAVLCQAQSSVYSARPGASARASARTDCGDADQDQAVRSTDPATKDNGISSSAGCGRSARLPPFFRSAIRPRVRCPL